MRFLIAAAVLACAAAVPSGLLTAPYAHGLVGHAGLAVGYSGLAVAHAAPLAVGIAPALPTISSGDIQGAAIEAHVEASDHARAAVDTVRQLNDKAAELHGEAINTAVENSWKAVDTVKTVEAQLDGAAAGAAPIIAKQLAGHVAPVAAYAAAPVLAGHAAYAAAPVLAGHAAYAAAPVLAGHAAYAAAPVLAGHAAYSTGPVLAGHAAYAGPAVTAYGAYGIPTLGASKTVVTQSLSQTHPGALIAPAAYAHGIAHGW